MVSRLGFDTDDDFALLRHCLEVTDTYRPMLEGLTYPPDPGSELHRLDALLNSNISPSTTLVISQRTAVGCVLHLAEIFRAGQEPRAFVAIALSRAALVSGSHLVYMLQPPDPQVREAHARQLLRRQASSHLSGIRSFTTFEQLRYLKAPTTLATTLEQAREDIGGSNKPEGLMVLEMADLIAQALVDGSYASADQVGALREHFTWIWHVWSGASHGWAWPQFVPGLHDDDHDVAPGHWATDFFNVAAMVQRGVQLLVDASRQP